MTNQIPTVICGGHDKIFSPDDIIAIGFGYAALLCDGKTVWQETPEMEFDYCLTGAQAEEIASGSPNCDWRIIIDGPFCKEVYQRQRNEESDDYIWKLIQKADGFA